MKVLLALLALLLGACASGGGVQPQPPPSPQRTDLLMGYYGGCPSCATETKDHANLYMTRPWGPGGDLWLAETIPQLQQALDNGQKVMLGLPGAYGPNAEGEMRAALTRIRDAGLAAHIVALYPIDEPDVNGKSDAEVNATNVMLKRVMQELGLTAALAVFYACPNNNGRPGLSTYDWIGCDEYGVGCSAANGAPFLSLKHALTPTQRLLLIPGGANPWRQDPDCFLRKANDDKQVVAIMPFLWVDWEQPGIRVNGMKPTYCRLGRVIKGADPSTC